MTDTFQGLVDEAAAVLHPHRVDDRLFGDVACALVTQDGDHFRGVCLDTPCGTGFCAEAAAIAAMVTARQYRITTIVAVWRDDDGVARAVAPCGRCREFIHQVDPGNIDCTVVLGPDRAVPLRELLPVTDWPSPWS